MKFILINVLLFLSFNCTKNDDIFLLQDAPVTYFPGTKIETISAIDPKVSLDSINYISNSLPSLPDNDGTTDYTTIIQKVLDRKGIIIFPDFPLLINPNGLTVRSNSKIFFQRNTKLIFQENNRERYEVIRVHNVQNVELYNINILGDREIHIGNSGEWGFGISIKSSQNVIVKNAVIKNCWGDGIYLGSSGSIINKNVFITNCLIDNNRRNGISIISGIDISIENTLISNTNGTLPMSGIDLEPNNNEEILSNINIVNLSTFNNAREGILIVLRSLTGKEAKKIDINIKNHIDDASKYAMGFALDGHNPELSGDIAGEINIIEPLWKNNESNLVHFHGYENNKVQLNFVKPIIVDFDVLLSNQKREALIKFCEQNQYFSFIK